MLRQTNPVRNFYMFGRRRGPSNHLFLQGGVGHTNDCAPAAAPQGFKPVARHLVRHECKDCKFVWRFDRIAIRCLSEPSHNKIEIGLHHNWMWNKAQPVKFYEQLGQGYWPQMGIRLHNDTDSSKTNRERRSAGLTTEMLKRAKWQQQLSRKTDPFRNGGKAVQWRAHFPYPS